MGPFGGYPDGSQQWTNSNQPIRKSSPNWGGRADVHVSADPAMSNFDESMARRSHILGRVLSGKLETPFCLYFVCASMFKHMNVVII